MTRSPSPAVRLALLPDEEDACWVDVFAEACDLGCSDEVADALAWAGVVAEFPRLAAFDGCQP